MVERRGSHQCLRAWAAVLLLSLCGCLPWGRESTPIRCVHKIDSQDIQGQPGQTAAPRQPAQLTVAMPAQHAAESGNVRLASTEISLAEPPAPMEPPTRAEPLVVDLVAEALAVNPQILRLEAEARAAWQRVPQARALPDPMLEGTAFGEPQVMADGEMRGTFMVSQTLPYFKQLSAQGQEAAFEALILQQETDAARLRVAADVEETWYRLYLLGQLLRINEANRRLVSSLLEIATGRVEVGEATPGDVVLGALEISRSEEERLMLQQQLTSRKAMLNQLLNRSADSPLPTPQAAADVREVPSLETLRSLASANQPEVVASRLRTEATAWGVRSARLRNVPDVTLSYEHMFMRMNPGEHGSDPWRVGLGINVPLWRGKYSAMEQEARQRNFAAHLGVEEALREYDSIILDLREQAIATERTARLYSETIIPQSRQSLESDQRAYSQGTVTFERVVNDAQNILTAESALYRALTDNAIAVARLKQAVGGTLPQTVEELAAPPPMITFPD